MERNTTFDIMKGIGILAVIAGHTFTSCGIHKLIYSFHMPLFFFIAGYFYKENHNYYNKLKNDLKRLIVPYIFTFIILWIYLILIYNDTSYMIKYGIEAITWSSGGKHTSSIWPIIPTVGPIWFLMALFWCRTFYNMIACQFKLKYIIAISLAIAATIIDRSLINLPAAILPGLSALVFYTLGNYLRTNNINKWQITLCACCWVLHLLFSEIDMCICLYRLYPIDILGGLFGIILIYYISKQVSKLKIHIFFIWTGKVSLIILCIHTLEFNIIKYDSFLPFMNQETCLFAARTITCLLITFLWYKISQMIKAKHECPASK